MCACSVMSDYVHPIGYRLLCPWDSPGKNTRMGSLSLLQGIFPTQRSNSGLPHCRWILYQLSHKGSPRILEWVEYPFSRGSTGLRNRTGVSSIAGRFFTNWAIREACTFISSTVYYPMTHSEIMIFRLGEITFFTITFKTKKDYFALPWHAQIE